MKPRSPRTPQTETIFFAMGTTCSIAVFGTGFENALTAAKNRVLELHRKLNAYDAESEIAAINLAAGERFVEISDDTLWLIRNAVAWSETTGGMFDITTTPLSLLWKRAIRDKTLPDEDKIAAVLALTGHKDILIRGNNVMLRRHGMSIDLGATAKGYAADEVLRILTEHGVKDFVINLGGTVIVHGKERYVGLQHPFRRTGTSFGSISVRNKAIVTSGLYEQGFTVGGRTYHHIVDPRTGYPSQSGTAGVTLIGDNAETLDAMSTTAFMMPIDRAAFFVKQIGAEAVFVSEAGDVFVTDGLRNGFELTGKGA